MSKRKNEKRKKQKARVGEVKSHCLVPSCVRSAFRAPGQFWQSRGTVVFLKLKPGQKKKQKWLSWGKKTRLQASFFTVSVARQCLVSGLPCWNLCLVLVLKMVVAEELLLSTQSNRKDEALHKIPHHQINESSLNGLPGSTKHHLCHSNARTELMSWPVTIIIRKTISF